MGKKKGVPVIANETLGTENRANRPRRSLVPTMADFLRMYLTYIKDPIHINVSSFSHNINIEFM